MFPAGIQNAIAKHLPETVEIWSDGDATPAAPRANRDEFGFPVKTASAQNPSGIRKVGEMRGQLAPAARFRANGKQANVSEQVLAAAEWVISVPESPSLDIQLGDEIRIGARRFPVLFAGGADSHCPLRLVWCQEIT